MVCSSCGFENQGRMRFCGMCGTPLPHPPMTAPGATSTLNFTRVPVEASAPPRERSAGTSTARSAVTAETMGRNGGSTPAPQASAPAAVEEPVEPVEQAETGAIEPASEAAVEAPAHELVPDVPLDEYVQSFHYEPPSEPTEITMRGDSSVAEQRAVADKVVVADSVAADASEQDVIAAARSNRWRSSWRERRSLRQLGGEPPRAGARITGRNGC